MKALPIAVCLYLRRPCGYCCAPAGVPCDFDGDGVRVVHGERFAEAAFAMRRAKMRSVAWAAIAVPPAAWIRLTRDPLP